jgi:SRSO17 transposase
VALRLFLPQSWTSDTRRVLRAGVPEERLRYRTKAEIALEEMDRIRRLGVAFGCVLADAAYGMSARFRGALSERGLRWAVGIPHTQKVYEPTVELVQPPAGRRGRPRKHALVSHERRSVEQVLGALPETAWQELSWRRGTKGPLRARFAAVRVRVADGEEDAQGAHLPGEEVWLVGEHRKTGERKYYVSNYPGEAPLEVLASTIKARWVCEQAHQQLKEELGLDHYEGRSWNGLHHHALMALIAFAFLQHQRLETARQEGKKSGSGRSRPAAPAEPSGDSASPADRVEAGAASAVPRMQASLPI